MAKRRKKRSAPNISEEAIERARQQLGEADALEQPVEAQEDQAADTDPPHESRQKRRRRERRERSGQAQSEIVQYSQISKRKRETLDHETIEQMLANPTKFVTEEELREDYRHVITDLKSMGMLAAVLMIALVALAQLI